MSNVAIYTSAGNFGDLDGDPTLPGGETLTTTAVSGFQFEAGAAPFFSTVLPDGTVIIGTDPLSDNQVNSTFVTQSIATYNPATAAFASLLLPTTTGATTIVGANGKTGGADVSDVDKVKINGEWRPIGVAAVDYRSNQTKANRYYGWIVLKPDGAGGWTFDTDRSWTMDQLATSPDFGSNFATITDINGASLAVNPGFNEIGVFPQSGHVAIACYFSQASIHSGRVVVIDPQATDPADAITGWFNLPAFTLADATAITYSPRNIACDPSSALGDERFVIIADTVKTSDATAIPFAVQEFSYNATIGVFSSRILPTSAPFQPILDDDGVAYASYNARCNQTTFTEDGTLYVATSRATGLTSFNSQPVCVWTKTPGGERSYVAASPPSAGYENSFANRVMPDFFVGTTIVAGAVARGLVADPVTRGVIQVGNNGDLLTFIPDFPLVERTNRLPNGSFTSDITGWAASSGSSVPTWDSGDSGRMRIQCNPGGIFSNSDVTTPTGLSGFAVPSGLIGQAIHGWAEMKAASTLRTFQVAVTFFQSDGSAVAGGVVFGPKRQESNSGYVRAYYAAAVPATAAFARLVVRINSAAAAEVHYMGEAYVAMSPFTSNDIHDLDLTGLRSGQTSTSFQIRGASIDPTHRRLWFAYQQLESTATCASYPCTPYRLPQWLFQVDTDWLFGDAVAATVDSGPDAFTDIASALDSRTDISSAPSQRTVVTV